MNIRDLAAARGTANLFVVSPRDSLVDAARLLASHNVGALIVIDANGRMAGIVSERDLIRAMARDPAGTTETTVSDVMTRSVVTCSEDQAVAEVFARMNAHRIRHIPVLRDGTPMGMISLRELTLAYESALNESHTDLLTGVPNRRHFLECLDAEVARAARYRHVLSVAMLDIDHFKRVNDTYGHDGGDRVLRAVSGAVARQLRTSDRLGRLGGEEFGLYFPETNLAGAKIACARILDAIRATPIPLDGVVVHVTVSIGLHTLDAPGRGEAGADAASLLASADRLLYCAKESGRDRLFSDDDTDGSAARHVVPMNAPSLHSAA